MILLILEGKRYYREEMDDPATFRLIGNLRGKLVYVGLVLSLPNEPQAEADRFGDAPLNSSIKFLA